MLNVKSVDEVFDIIKDNFSNYETGNEILPLRQALGRQLAFEVTAREDVPGFNRSSVDGYAVIASDTFGASEAMPAQLKLAGEVKMGVKPGHALMKGEAMYIPTGGELPENADAVVMIEYSEDYKDGFIYLNKSAAPGNNVVFRGDDIKCGSRVMAAGKRLRPQDIGVLAAMGICLVEVKKPLKVGIISTGDEVADINEEMTGSCIRDVNTYSLHSGILELGAIPICYGIVKDDFNLIEEAAKKALDECDIVLISGGSSVGAKDETYKVIDSLGKPGVLVHGIAVKPGKPTIIGKIGRKAVVGLPGHPASAFFIFRIFGARLIEVMAGGSFMTSRVTSGNMAVNYPSNNGREEFLPVRIEKKEEKNLVWPVFGKSGLITLLSSAQGYVHIGRGAEGLSAGQDVEVILF
ncbi:MAG: molybdopterin molybdotransferase MoeA [Clostridia bacterium]|nr:molybdopterin molybdotransferase MoeA [Clostridia bacterium]